MGDEIAVRAANIEDVEAIAGIRVAGWRTAYRGLIEQAVLDRLDPVAEAATRRARWAERPPAAVAELGGVVVGFVLTCPYRTADDEPGWTTDPGGGEIAALYVAPDVQGRGVGRVLLKHGLTELAAAGHPVARLWVLAGNTRARRFYTAAGFTDESPAGVMKDFVPHGGERATPEVRYGRCLP